MGIYAFAQFVHYKVLADAVCCSSYVLIADLVEGSLDVYSWQFDCVGGGSVPPVKPIYVLHVYLTLLLLL